MRTPSPSRGFAGQEATPRCCDHPGCYEPGEHRAPKSRDQLDEYLWFCLDHIRDYNKAWNYYAGMTPEQIELETRRDTTWQRPTWPLGARSSGGRRFNQESVAIHDGFACFGEDGGEHLHAAARARAAGFHPDSAEARALATIDLEPPLTLTRLKARYKELVKQHHPDANGGDKRAEERLKVINEANAILKKALTD